MELSSFLYLVLFASAAFAVDKIEYKDQQVWQIVGDNLDELNELESILIDPAFVVEHSSFLPDQSRKIFLRLPQREADFLRSHLRSTTLKYDVIVPNVQDQLDLERMENEKRMKRSITSLEDFDYSQYHPIEEIEEWMDFVASEYDFVTKTQVGVSLEGRPLSALRISMNPGYNNSIFYMDAATHAREWISPATLMYVCNQILTNSSYSDLLNNLDYIFVPVVNLDGYSYTWTDDRLWRKTRRPYSGISNDSLCVGVDANRNWDVFFGGAGSSEEPCSIFYRGPTAESEPVIKHVAKLIRDEKEKIKGVVSFHNWGQQILYPYNGDLTMHPPTESELNSTGEAMGKAIQGVNGVYYEWGRGADILYVFSGSTSDWTYKKAGIELSFTIELRDTGTFHFELPSDQILPTGKEVMAGIAVLGRIIIEKYS